jgi:serine/threonine protein phosphatase PrpC
VSDRGLRHSRNEDAAAITGSERRGARAVLVVCDGVSSAQGSDVASLAAARAARDVLASSRATGMATPESLAAALGARLEAAADAASQAVAAGTCADPGQSPPSCTFVAAVLEGDLVVAGVVGDSRAYWLPDEGAAVAMTVDDSWAAEQIAAGTARAQAESAPQAHAITRWLGVDAPDHTPRLTSQRVEVPGWLLLCSDGLWNYCSPADELADLVRRTTAATSGDPLAVGEALVAWANEQGGHDNITVALARVGGGLDDGGD